MTTSVCWSTTDKESGSYMSHRHFYLRAMLFGFSNAPGPLVGGDTSALLHPTCSHSTSQNPPNPWTGSWEMRCKKEEWKGKEIKKGVCKRNGWREEGQREGVPQISEFLLVLCVCTAFWVTMLFLPADLTGSTFKANCASCYHKPKYHLSRSDLNICVWLR